MDIPAGTERLVDAAQRGQFVVIQYADGTTLSGAVHRRIVRHGRVVLSVRWGTRGAVELDGRSLSESLVGQSAIRQLLLADRADGSGSKCFYDADGEEAPPPPAPPAEQQQPTATTTATTSDEQQQKQQQQQQQQQKQQQQPQKMARSACSRPHRYALNLYRSKTQALAELAGGAAVIAASSSNVDDTFSSSLRSLCVPMNSNDIFQQPTSEAAAPPPSSARLYRYKRGPKIGEGAFGEVFAAVDTHTGAPVAVKVLRRADHSDGGGLHNTIVRELLVAQSAAQPLLIPFLDVIFAGDGSCILVMPLIDHDVTALLRRGGVFATALMGQVFPRYELIRCVLGQLLEALDELHRVRGVEHRDVKSSNVLVRADGVVQLGDFGWSRLAPAPGAPHTGPPCSINYRPLDLLMGVRAYDGDKIDIYGAGCVFYELLTGRLLFAGHTEAEVALTILQTLGAPPPHVAAAYPAKIDGKAGYSSQLGRKLRAHGVERADVLDLLTRMLDYEPARRPPAAELLQHAFFAGYQPVLPRLRVGGGSGLGGGEPLLVLPEAVRAMSAALPRRHSFRWEMHVQAAEAQRNAGAQRVAAAVTAAAQQRFDDDNDDNIALEPAVPD